MAYKNLKPGDRVRIKQHLRLANAGYCGTVTADGRRVLIDADAKWSPGKEYDYDEDELELIDRVVETRTFKVGDRVKCVGSTLSVEGKTGTVTKLTPYITVDFDDSPKGYTFDPDTAKKYLVALDKQNENEIQIGDTVRIVRKTGGTPQWNATHMDATLGRTGIVKKIHTYDGPLEILVEGEPRTWFYHRDAVEKVMPDLVPTPDAHTTAMAKLKAGDTVIVTRAVPSNDGGWDNSWVEEMDAMVGQTTVIEKLNDKRGVLLKGQHYYFPAHVLEKHNATSAFQVGDRVVYMGKNTLRQGMKGSIRTSGSSGSKIVHIDWDDSSGSAEFTYDLRPEALHDKAPQFQVGDPVHRIDAPHCGGIYLRTDSTGWHRYRSTAYGGEWAAAPDNLAYGAPSTEPSTPATPTPSTSKDSTMSSLTPVNIEQRTFVTLPGTTPTDAKNLTDDQLIEAIAQGEAEIERLGKIKAGSKGVAARIAKLQEGVDGLVALLDARTDDGKAKKAAK